MLFNSIDFAFFFPIVFILYWFITQKNLKIQNLLILVASYIFYGWWDWKFLSLLFFSTLADYFIGIGLNNNQNQKTRKLLLWLSISINLGFLGFFKYYNFFIENLINSFTFFGYQLDSHSLNIILPVGISFYTFQTMSYTIDVYNRKLEPTKDFISFAAFVSFFPQLVAGPIERATNLLPQFFKERKFEYKKAIDGLRQILWGLFKKVVIADNCAEYANLLFNNTDDYQGLSLVLGAVFFAIQIYGDFSGYSDIAIGTSRLFGFELMRNFNFPYFSRDIAEFWRKWHISLSTWFRDYLYIPLGGSKGSLWFKVRNTFIIFIVSGLWHGANWTFIIWGILNALYFLPLLLSNNNRKNLDSVSKDKLFPSLKELAAIVLTFTLSTFAWIFFRAESLSHAGLYIKKMFSGLIKKEGIIEVYNLVYWKIKPEIFILLIIFFTIEWLGREDQHPLAKLGLTMKRNVRYLLYYSIIIAIICFGGKEQEFIYFQF